MSEREIREVLAAIASELDARARARARKLVLPAALAATMALPACAYGVPDEPDTGDAVADTVSGTDAADSAFLDSVEGPDLNTLYAAPEQ